MVVDLLLKQAERFPESKIIYDAVNSCKLVVKRQHFCLSQIFKSRKCKSVIFVYFHLLFINQCFQMAHKTLIIGTADIKQKQLDFLRSLPLC